MTSPVGATVEVVATPELGNRTYVVHDGTVAVVVDAPRDHERVGRVLADRSLTLAAVLETHVHNDYVTGGLALARAAGADYLVSADETVEFVRRGVTDGDELAYDGLTVAVLSTPGHTPHHLSYAIRSGGTSPALFTGGSLLHGTVGRTDLCGPDLTEPLARAQYRSVHRLAASLPGPTQVFPTHGFGSFCAAVGGPGDAVDGHPTLRDEQRANLALTEPSEDVVVQRLLAGYAPYPRYYEHMAPLNRLGPEAATEDVTLVDWELALAQLTAGVPVVDVRPRAAFAEGHLAGSLNVELGAQFTSYAGWVVPWGEPLLLVAETVEEVREAAHQLARIGVDDVRGAIGAATELAARPEVTASFRRTTFAELERERTAPGVRPLDVRGADERDVDRVRGSHHLTVDDLVAGQPGPQRPGETWWVHCASGFRASVAAGLLDARGHRVVLVDDEFDHAADLGLTLVRRLHA